MFQKAYSFIGSTIIRCHTCEIIEAFVFGMTLVLFVVAFFVGEPLKELLNIIALATSGIILILKSMQYETGYEIKLMKTLTPQKVKRLKKKKM